MAKSIKLKLDSQFDFLLIGIVTTEPIYRLSWLINQEISISLSDSTPIQLLHKQTKAIQLFTRFACKDEGDSFFELIQNKGSNGVLIEEQKQFDFFLKITDSQLDGQETIKRLKNVPNISLVMVILPESLKSKDRLISYTEGEE